MNVKIENRRKYWKGLKRFDSSQYNTRFNRSTLFVHTFTPDKCLQIEWKKVKNHLRGSSP